MKRTLLVHITFVFLLLKSKKLLEFTDFKGTAAVSQRGGLNGEGTGQPSTPERYTKTPKK